MQVSKEGIERIRQASPIDALAAERGIALRRRGRDLFGLCPFHEEKTGSFSVSPSKGLLHCFGCHEAGDVFALVGKLDGIGFPEALDVLATRAGLDAGKETGRRHRGL